MGGRLWGLGLALLAALVPLASCGSDDERGPAVDQCAIFPEPCVDPAMCCSGICAVDVCTCTPTGAPCIGDSECCDGKACVNGVCADGCRGNGARCTSSTECCSGACEGPIGNCAVPRCNSEGESCAGSGDCCSGLACRDGACAAGCGIDGAKCVAASDCCGGYACDISGECARVCAEELEVCEPAEGRLCCDGKKCVDGTCFACSAEGYTCASDADCCERMHCAGGVCSCQGDGESCSEDGDCCPGTECFGGTCACAPIGERCSTTKDCCTGGGMDLVCEAGECRPATCHPNTWVCADATDCCQGGCEAGSCCGAEGSDCQSSQDTCCSDQACWTDTLTCKPCGQPGAACSVDRECCDEICIDGSCRSPLGEACSTGAQCEPLAACEGGACCGTTNHYCAPGECCANYICNGTHCRGLPGAACQNDSECHDEYPSITSNCVSGACCYRSNAPCTQGSDCCSGVCQAGKCACSATGKACDFTVDCCSGDCNFQTYTCNCGTNGDSCATGADCCAGYQCGSGGTCCGAVDTPCQNGSMCCSGTCKGNGTCG